MGTINNLNNKIYKNILKKITYRFKLKKLMNKREDESVKNA